MRCREAIDPALPIPELIKLIKHSFRECEFEEVQNILMERERIMEVEIQNVVRDLDSLKKQIDFLENTQSYLELEKCDLEEKLGKSQRRGQELGEKIVQSKEKFEKLMSEKSDVEEELGRSQRRGEELEKMIVRMKEKFEKLCEEMDERVVKMGKEIEELRREKLSATKTIEELKAKEIEADGVVRELKRKEVEAVKTIDELRAKKMKCEKANADDRAVNLSPEVPATPGNLAELNSW